MDKPCVTPRNLISVTEVCCYKAKLWGCYVCYAVTLFLARVWDYIYAFTGNQKTSSRVCEKAILERNKRNTLFCGFIKPNFRYGIRVTQRNKRNAFRRSSS